MDRPKKDWRLILANITAFCIYSLWSGLISVTIEMYFLNATFKRWVEVRVVYFVFKVALSDIVCANLTNAVRKVLRSSPKHRFRQGVADSFSVSTYQQAIYVPSALIVGANWASTIFAAKFYFVEGLLIGWVYGLFLNWCRKKIAGVENYTSDNKK